MFSEEGFRYATQGLAGAKKWAELDLEARKRYQLNPSNRFALRTVALAKALQGVSGTGPRLPDLDASAQDAHPGQAVSAVRPIDHRARALHAQASG